MSSKKISRKGRRLIHALLKTARGYNARAVDDEIARVNRKDGDNPKRAAGETLR